jgi:hypothetical protein
VAGSTASPCARSLSTMSVIWSVFQLRPQLVDNVGDLERIPVQDRIGHQAQAAGLVHDFPVIPRREFALVGKENPAR